MATREDSDEMHPLLVRSLPAHTPFGTLIVIPIEVRLKIYRILIERGKLAILRTSRAINEEAVDDLYKFAVCRLGFDYYAPFKISSSRVPWSRVQNLELRVKFKGTHRWSCINHFNEWLQRYGALMTDLKACKIRLDYQPALYFMHDTFTGVKTLDAFPMVALVIAVIDDPDAATSMRPFSDSPQPDPDRDMYLDMHCTIREYDFLGYQWAASVLKENLGSAVWFEDEKGMHLEFHPQQRAGLVCLRSKDGKVGDEELDQE
ncbi:MAG: hypothetical protein Q9175_003331 [Cornicularia normoerica]